MARRARRPPSLKLILGGLAAGALALPFGLAGIVVLVLSTRGAEQSFIQLREVSIELERAARIDSAGNLSLIPGYFPPPDFELVVAGREGAILYSTSPRFAVGARADLGDFADAAREDFATPSFFAEPLSLKGRAVGSYYAWLPMSKSRGEGRFSRSAFGSLALLALVAIVFSLGVLVATQLARAVLKLERAAGRIAAGDFETAVSVRGIREIEDLARAMDGMRRALSEDRDQRARFLAAVSHDLRTPLTSIGGYLEAVDDGLASDPATLERYVRIMRGKTRLLETRIGGLLDFARMETEEWRMGFESVELRPFLEGLAREAREDAVLMGRRFEADLYASDDLRLPIDRSLLSRAFENVISNALHYTPEGGLVRLSTRPREGVLCIDVDDEGPGIPASERERVFEPFYRGSSAREGEGSGLGLYIARSILRGHGWEIEAGESPLGGGRVSVLIPEISRDA
ncbi:MAG: HAMP domain-containing sensor histidine kinase [Rectinemataceae bacterium]|jgi:signal transduction histidine kinase